MTGRTADNGFDITRLNDVGVVELDKQRTAAFCTLCKFWKLLFDMPLYRELQ